MSPYAEQLRAFISQFSIAQKIVLFTVMIGVVSALIAVSVWANRPEWSLLYSGLIAEDADEMVTQLREDGIPYRLTKNGTTIYVPEENVTNYRLSFAASGLTGGSVTGYELFDEQRMGMTTFMQRVNYQRALEGELTQTINQMDEIKLSRVHLVIPEKKFFEEGNNASASIILHLNPGARLTSRQIAGITALVANSVPDLMEEHVSIIDASGKLLSEAISGDKEAAVGARNWEIRKSVESDLQRKAQSLLDDVLRPGKSVVKVSATLNFEQLERTREFYDTEDAAILSEERNTENYTGADTSNRVIEQTVTNYELNKTIEHFVASSAEIERLSVAVLVDGKYETDEKTEEQAYIPIGDAELEQIRSLVSNSLGLDLDRGDDIVVQNIQFNRVEEMVQIASVQSQERRRYWTNMGTNVIMVIALVVSLYFLLGAARNTAARVNITKLFAPPPEDAAGIMVTGPGQVDAIAGAAGTLQASGEQEMVSDSFMAKLSPEARAQLEAADQMTADVTAFAEENPEGAAQLLRIWTSARKVVEEEE